MRKKIVVLYLRAEDQKNLAEIFQESVQLGAEVFFCESKELALKLIEQEHPHLLIIDAHFEIPEQKIPILTLYDKKERVEGLQRPLHKNQVLGKCLPILDLIHIENAEEIPM